ASGLGLATHPVVALALPAVAIFAWPAVVRVPRAAGLAAVAAFVAPLSLYAYIPLRSGYVETHGLDPGMAAGVRGGAFFDYGAPSTGPAFWSYITGASFHPSDAFASFASRPGATHALDLAHALVYHEYSFAALAFALVGFGYLAAGRRRIALGLAVVLCGALAFVPNFRAESDSLRYALPALWALSAAAATGADWVARAVAGERPRLATLLAVAAIMGGLWPNAATALGDVQNLRRIDDARDVGPEIARRTVDGSLIVAAWTFATPLAYDAYVERDFGSRRVLSGWPHEFPGRYAAWRARYGHVYVVVGNFYDVTPYARTIYVAERWQLAEVR
ncbi:MAG: hypothetical protein IAI50_12485, partial [Candidatus Eremiobacteraeota bacterium]|nr:hypothetical protein [Candidatus Eremiobacteraeota bacterium]